jgi:hypothetical protein
MRAFPFPLLALAATAAASADLPDLSAHRRKHRVLLIETPSAAAPAYQLQAAALLPAWPGLLERDLHIITRESAPAFRVRLIGKDGGVKLDRTEPLAAADLFALIDAMPVRQAERERSRATGE